MANAKLSLGGTGVANYRQCAGTPQFMGAPYGQRRLPRSPHYDAHADGAMAPAVSIISLPVHPVDLEVQRNNLQAANLAVGDGIFLTYLPVNHILEYIRFDVSDSDPIMAGATATLCGWLEEWDEGAKEFTLAELPDIAAAATAQGVTAIDLSKPSSTTVSLLKVEADYVSGLYLAPKLVEVTDAAGNTVFEWHQSAAVHLGLKIVSMPSNKNGAPVPFEAMRGAWHFSALVKHYECMASV